MPAKGFGNLSIKMDITVENMGGLQARTLIRRAGYAEHVDRRSGETSYVRRLSPSGFYPRFHAYLHPREDGSLMIRLHIDQKQPSYGVGHAHSGEYDGPLLEGEKVRIMEFINKEIAAAKESKKEDVGFFKRLFKH